MRLFACAAISLRLFAAIVLKAKLQKHHCVGLERGTLRYQNLI
jgi:hypothetical protein